MGELGEESLLVMANGRSVLGMGESQKLDTLGGSMENVEVLKYNFQPFKEGNILCVSVFFVCVLGGEGTAPFLTT